MSDYSEFYLNSAAAVAQLDLLEISHPDFTQTYYVVRNATDGVTVTLEDLSSQAFEYYPLRIEPAGTRDNLDFGLSVTLGDLGEVLPVELDAIATASGYDTKPTVKYRTYRSDDLTAPLFGPIELEVTSFNFNREGSTFEAKAPSLNIVKTGETYKLERFPMLKGFL
jgi:hypothetical protein